MAEAEAYRVRDTVPTAPLSIEGGAGQGKVITDYYETQSV